jgi:hypothetical protein
MSLVASLPSSGSNVSSLTASTSSTIALGDILVGLAITIGVLVFLLAIYDVMSQGDSRNANTVAALRTICVPLIVTFCAWLMLEAATRL